MLDYESLVSSLSDPNIKLSDYKIAIVEQKNTTRKKKNKIR